MLRLPPISGGGGRRRCRRRRRRSPGRWSRRPGRQGRERAKNLLWAAGKLADYGIGLGLEAVPEVLLHPSTAERFTRCAPGLSGAARRTLRTNLRFIGRRVVPHLYPADLPLPRERAKQPYSAGGDRRVPRAGGRAAHGGAADARGGTGLPGGGRRADPRRPARRPRHRRRAAAPAASSSRSAGRAPRTVPVLARYHRPLLAAARSAGDGLVCGGAEPGRRNLTNRLVGLPRRRGRPAAAGHLPAARDLARRLRASCWAWPRSCARPGSAAPSGSATSSPAWSRAARKQAVPAAGGRPAMIPLAALEERHRRLRRRAADRGDAARPAPGRGSWPSAPCCWA